MKLLQFLCVSLFLVSSMLADLRYDLVTLANRLEALQLTLIVEASEAQPQPEEQVFIDKKLEAELKRLDEEIERNKQRAEEQLRQERARKRMSLNIPREPLIVPEIPIRPEVRVPPLAQTTEGLSIPQKRKLIRSTSTYIPKPSPEEKPQTIQEAAKARLERTKIQRTLKQRPSLMALPIKIEDFAQAPVKLRTLATRTNTLPLESNKKEAAQKLINEINNTKFTITNEKDRQLLYHVIKGILSINPLLIQTGLVILQSRVPKAALYNLMTFLYGKRIDYLEYEFGQIQPGYKLSKGIRDDIDEGLAYPIEISGEVQDAEIKSTLSDDTDARDFYNKINEQWLRLLLLLRGLSKEQKEALLDEGIDIDEYLESAEENKLRAYCVYDPKLKTKECRPYKSFYEELAEMAQTAQSFNDNQERYINNRTRRTFAIQNIINKLKAFAAFAQNPKICQVCLDEDAQKASEEVTKRDFQEIINFFKERLSEEPENKKYVEILNTIESIKEEEAKRRGNIRKFGVGSTSYQ